jgi:hypothetical protein
MLLRGLGGVLKPPRSAASNRAAASFFVNSDLDFCTMSQPAERREEFQKLSEAIGFAMIAWQTVEVAHFKLFLKMLGAPQKEICSVVYFSIESFDSRHKMIGRVAHYFLQGDHYDKHRITWAGTDGGLYKKIKDANENRNKVAHYDLYFDIRISEKPDGGQDYILGLPRLAPNPQNLVSHLLGRTADAPGHKLSPEEIKAYASTFQALGTEIDDFQKNLTLPPPQQGLGLLGLLAPPLDLTAPPPPLPKTPPAKDDPSSA